MKKFLLTSIAVAFSFLLFAQAQNQDHAHGRFYASYDDYINNKPVDGYAISDYTTIENNASKQTFMVVSGDKPQKEKIANMPFDLFTVGRQLMRRHKDETYMVMSAGALCYYVKYNQNSEEYYSETITGEPISFNDKILEKYLAQYNLLDEYKADKPKREFKDNVDDYFTKQVARKVKYFNLLNEKMKK